MEVQTNEELITYIDKKANKCARLTALLIARVDVRMDEVEKLEIAARELSCATLELKNRMIK